MSSKELSWALEAEVDHPMKRWLLVCIAELLYPNTSDLIELSKMKRSTVYEILGKLGKDNLVIKTEHNRYLLNTDSVHVMDSTTYEQFRELDSEVCAETEEKEGELVREPDLEDNTIINTNYTNNNNNYNNYNNNTIELEKTQNLEVWEEALSQDWRWKPFATERLRRDWINKKKSEAEQSGVDLSQVADSVLYNLSKEKNLENPDRDVRRTFAKYIGYAREEIRKHPRTIKATELGNPDIYSQKLAERGDN